MAPITRLLLIFPLASLNIFLVWLNTVFGEFCQPGGFVIKCLKRARAFGYLRWLCNAISPHIFIGICLVDYPPGCLLRVSYFVYHTAPPSVMVQPNVLMRLARAVAAALPLVYVLLPKFAVTALLGDCASQATKSAS